jgi:hypothetical protein
VLSALKQVLATFHLLAQAEGAARGLKVKTMRMPFVCEFNALIYALEGAWLLPCRARA